MASRQQVAELHRKLPHLTIGEIERSLDDADRERAFADSLAKPGDVVPVEHFSALLTAMKAIRDGLADTGSVRGQRMTLITKAEAFEIADAAIKAARGCR